MSRQIAIYGRGGVGASTVAANISAALTVACIELGDPFIRGECASRAIAQALGALVELDLEGQLTPDLIIYDICLIQIELGDFS
jgi:nitrogenase subunit NifH